MKRLKLLLSVALIFIVACQSNQLDVVEPIATNDDCEAYVPFYEQFDTLATKLKVECGCKDSIVDLNNKLGPYTKVSSLDFKCDVKQFDLIPKMPSVKHLISEVITENVLAFPNLEVLENKTFMENPLPVELMFLPDLKELILFNPKDFPSILGTKPLEVFKVTFQNTATESVELPNNFHNLRNLKELNIYNIDRALFSNFEYLAGLECLRLSNVLWGRIPRTANQWPLLKTLEVSNVDIRGGVPDIFEGKDSLTSVYISETELSTNEQLHIFKAPNLQELTFSFCELGPIPDEIGDLTSLAHLIISTDQHSINNSITIPATIGNLVNLKSIFISINSDQFPSALLELKNTIESVAVKDEIGSLPTSIGDFSVLKTLKLSHCGLNSLPDEIKNLANTLEELHLTGNSFDESTKQQIEEWLPDTEIFF